jgi:site-specific recombinase XerD
MEEAKIEGAVHHTARHTFCSCLVEKGASAHEIMATAGHKTLAVSTVHALESETHSIRCRSDRYGETRTCTRGF